MRLGQQDVLPRIRLVQLDGLTQGLKRWPVPSALGEQIAAPGVGVGQVWIQRQRNLKILCGRGPLLDVEKGLTAPCVGLGQRIVQLEGPVKVLDRVGRRIQRDVRVPTLQAQRGELEEQVSTSNTELDAVAEELNQLKQISGKAVQLDADNRRLVVEAEKLRSQVEMLEAENQRLVDKLRSEDFINGALAVLLGVIITLVVPRLWPKRRRSSGWA